MAFRGWSVLPGGDRRPGRCRGGATGDLVDSSRHTGNKSEAARLLRVDYKPPHLKMKHYEIEAGDFRAS